MPSAPLPHIAESIVIGHIQTPLDGAVVVAPSTPSRSARRILREHRFDQAPVVLDDEPVGYVLASDLASGRGSVETRRRPILPSALAGEMTPLEDAIPWLEANRFLYVLRGRSISGFVVPSDLNRQAGRTYFYLAIAALELELADLVREWSRTRNVVDSLGSRAAGTVHGRLRKHQAGNVEADVVAEMDLSHLFQIVGTDQQCLEYLGLSDPEAWTRTWGPINELRVRTAHMARPLLETPEQFSSIVDVSKTTKALLEGLREWRNEHVP